MIRISNIDPKSSLKRHHISLTTSSTLAAVAGIMPADGELDKVYVGATAAVATAFVTLSINGSAQSALTVSTVPADGVAKVDGPTSPRHVSAGSLIELAVSATAAFAAVAITAEFLLKDSGK